MKGLSFFITERKLIREKYFPSDECFLIAHAVHRISLSRIYVCCLRAGDLPLSLLPLIRVHFASV